MADPVPAAGSIHVPGRLCANPTDLGLAFPHGGTDLGSVEAHDFLPGIVAVDTEDESLGGERTETVLACERALYQVELGAYSTAMAHRIYASTSAGGGGYGKAGDDSRLASAREFVLLFSPRYPTKHAGLIIYRACGSWQEAARIAFSIGRPIGAVAAFRGLRHASKGVYQHEYLSAMTL